MRIKFDETNIVEAYNVDVIFDEIPDETEQREFKGMLASLKIYTNAWPEPDCGEFDVSDCFTYDEARNKVQKFFDDLFINGFIDISTEEKRSKYGLTIY